MKKLCILFLMFFCLLFLQVKAEAGWTVQSFLLPGIDQALKGRWDRAGFFFCFDALALFCASGDIGENYWKDDGAGVMLGSILWGFSGLVANVDQDLLPKKISQNNIKIVACQIKF